MKLVANCKNHQVLFTMVDEPTITYQSDLQQFLEFCEEQGAVVYSHSLLRNFGELTPYLFAQGFDCIATDEKFGKRKQAFKKIESREGQVLRIEVKMKKRVVKFYDSKKLFNSTEEELRKSFSVEGDNLQVVAKCIQYLENQGLDKNTIGANAWFNYISTKFGSLHMAKRVFHELDEDAEDLARRAFRGGWCYLNPQATNKSFSGYCFDVNSMYPWIMYDHPLPAYTPVKFEGEPNWNDRQYPLFIVEVVLDYAILKEGAFPWLLSDYQLEKVVEEDYIVRRVKPVRAVLTNMELALLFETYDFGNIRYVKGYKFKATKALFKEYVQKWYQQKMTSTGAKKSVAKMMLNNLFGKFATKNKYKSQIYYISPTDGVEYKRELGEIEGSTLSYYTPIASFIAAYGRVKMVRTAMANKETFLYSDTDSVHLAINSLEEAREIEIHNDYLGYWKVERQFKDSKFLGLKCYAEQELNGNWVFKVAGLPKSSQEKLTIDQFYNGSQVELEVAKKVPGGVELSTGKFTIGQVQIGRISYLEKLREF